MISAKARSTAGITPEEFVPYWPKDAISAKERLDDLAAPENSPSSRVK